MVIGVILAIRVIEAAVVVLIIGTIFADFWWRGIDVKVNLV